MGALYSACMFLGVSNSSSVQPVVSIERTVFYRERAAGMYSAYPYAFAQASHAALYIYIYIYKLTREVDRIRGILIHRYFIDLTGPGGGPIYSGADHNLRCHYVLHD